MELCDQIAPSCVQHGRLPAGLCCYSHEELPPTFPTLRSLWTDPGPGPTTADGLFCFFFGAKEKQTRCYLVLLWRVISTISWSGKKTHDSQIHSVVEMNSSVWLTLDGVYFFNQGSPNRGTEGDRNLPVTRGGKGIHSSHGATLFFGFNFFPKSVESEKFFVCLLVCLFYERQPPRWSCAFTVTFEEWTFQSWRKSMISFTNSYSSGTAEWAKLVWLFVSPKTTSTPRTFPPSVCRLGEILSLWNFCLASDQCLLNVDVFILPQVIWCPAVPKLVFGTAACLDWPDIPFILYSATFCFPSLVFLDNVSLQTITSNPHSPSLFLPLHVIPHSSHPHSYLFYHLCVPRGMAGPVACTLVFSFFRLVPLIGRLICLRACPPTCD